MANLTHTQPRTYQVLPVAYLDYPVAAAKVYEGSALSDTSSTAPGVAGTNVAETLVATENFIGFANATVDNSAGVSGATINVVAAGVIQLVVTGVTAASVGATVYASDGNTFTLTSSGNTTIGKVIQIVSGTTVLVKFEGVGFRSI